jgi:hypothetical protein
LQQIIPHESSRLNLKYCLHRLEIFPEKSRKTLENPFFYILYFSVSVLCILGNALFTICGVPNNEAKFFQVISNKLLYYNIWFVLLAPVYTLIDCQVLYKVHYIHVYWLRWM